MRTVTLVGLLVALVYVLVPLGAGESRPPARGIETFGKPWTFRKFVSGLRDAGIQLAVETPVIADELPLVPGHPEEGAFPGPVLVAEGRYGPGGFSGYVLIYPSVGQRRETWPDEGPAPLVDGRRLIAEGVGLILDNAVVFRGVPLDPSYGPSVGALEGALRNLKE